MDARYPCSERGTGLSDMNNTKIRYSVSSRNFFTKLSAVLMGLAVVLRLLAYWGFWNNKSTDFIYTQIALPILSCLLFVAVILFCGKRFFALTAIPVLMGVVFFIIKSIGFESWIHTVLCIALYILVAALYTATVFGVVRTKWLLAPLFGLPLLYHIFIEDRNTLLANENAMSIGEWLPEFSVLCIMAALFFITFAMKRKQPKTLERVEGEQVIPDFDPNDESLPPEVLAAAGSGDEDE